MIAFKSQNSSLMIKNNTSFYLVVQNGNQIILQSFCLIFPIWSNQKIHPFQSKMNIVHKRIQKTLRVKSSNKNITRQQYSKSACFHFYFTLGCSFCHLFYQSCIYFHITIPTYCQNMFLCGWCLFLSTITIIIPSNLQLIIW